MLVEGWRILALAENGDIVIDYDNLVAEEEVEGDPNSSWSWLLKAATKPRSPRTEVLVTHLHLIDPSGVRRCEEVLKYPIAARPYDTLSITWPKAQTVVNNGGHFHEELS